MHHHHKAQAAVDFMMSYGIAMMIIFIAIAIIFKTGLLNPLLVPSTCNPIPGFGCSQQSINSTTGILTFTLAQATGTSITINGFACSMAPNAIGDKPQYGNIFVTNAMRFYPSGYDPSNALSPLPSGTSNTIKLYCYSGAGAAKGNIGNAFFGYVWLNYTVTGYGSIVQRVASITAKYD